MCRRPEATRLTRAASSESFRSPIQRLALADDGLGQGALGLQELGDPVFEGALADEAVDLHRSALADAVRPVAGLVLHGRVPPAVVVDDVGRPG